MQPVTKLRAKERRFLALLYAPGATVAIGLGAGDAMHRRGFVQVARGKHRWEITAEGRLAIEGYPADLAAYKVGR